MHLPAHRQVNYLKARYIQSYQQRPYIVLSIQTVENHRHLVEMYLLRSEFPMKASRLWTCLFKREWWVLWFFLCCWFVSFVPIFSFCFVLFLFCGFEFFEKSSGTFSSLVRFVGRMVLFHHFTIVRLFNLWLFVSLSCVSEIHKKNEHYEIKNGSTESGACTNRDQGSTKNNWHSRGNARYTQKRHVCTVHAIHRNHHAPKKCSNETHVETKRNEAHTKRRRRRRRRRRELEKWTEWKTAEKMS